VFGVKGHEGVKGQALLLEGGSVTWALELTGGQGVGCCQGSMCSIDLQQQQQQQQQQHKMQRHFQFLDSCQQLQNPHCMRIESVTQTQRPILSNSN